MFKKLTLAQNHMATTFSLTISAPRERIGCADEALKQAHKKIAELENELSEFREITPVCKLNHSRPGEKISAPQSLLQILDEAEDIFELTNGAFNFLAKGKEKTLDAIGWDETHVWRNSAEAIVGFGAIGKGFALDRARSIIECEGFGDYILSAGGSSIFVSGFESPKLPWQWGWSWKKNGEEPLGIALSHPTGRPTAIGVSGIHEKGNHIIDPRTGSPRTEAQQSFLVGFSSTTKADALSTAFFVLGWDDAIAVAQRMKEVPAMASALKDDKIIWNGKFESLWGSLANEKERLVFNRPALS